jgi:hypothetical protein
MFHEWALTWSPLEADYVTVRNYISGPNLIIRRHLDSEKLQNKTVIRGNINNTAAFHKYDKDEMSAKTHKM